METAAQTPPIRYCGMLAPCRRCTFASASVASATGVGQRSDLELSDNIAVSAADFWEVQTIPKSSRRMRAQL